MGSPCPGMVTPCCHPPHPVPAMPGSRGTHGGEQWEHSWASGLGVVPHGVGTRSKLVPKGQAGAQGTGRGG